MNKILYGLIFILFIGLVSSFYLQLNAKKDAYFVVATVYNSFDFKKELAVKFEEITKKKNTQLDSLKQNYSLKIDALENSMKVQPEELLQIKRQYQKLSEKIAQENAYLQQDYEAKIWERLNKYIEEYGKEQPYHFIYGASGNGVIFYADSTLNITNQLIEYVNSRHNDEQN